ncbi:hypothetical protein EW146_g384 [Bondarzewia mesenterica]|uniref:Dicer-like protein 1 n=1 Tax=Bondarzewia mesenterica TaxID=1095465 RepID=A0A4S4M738_9AGAM|nr:hypothetical protein EW146_g384 [Bondarzewia mesenterica]
MPAISSQVSPQPTPSLTPRHYQEEIFRHAQQGNVIAALDTGSGKTYIGIMLVKWIASQERVRGKSIVFIVPKVPLVEQQADFITKHTPLRVTQIHGSIALDMLNRAGWKKVFDNSDVLVMTAQIFLNILTHSHWSMDKVSLLIIDECHHARRANPVNVAMRDFYHHLPKEDRPKIFGMTASPTWRTKNPEQHLAVLEKNLDAKVITVVRHAVELEDHTPRPTEIICEYPASPDRYPGYPFPTIRSRYDWSKIPMSIDIPWSKIQTRYDVALESLGPFAAEFFLYTELQRRILNLMSPSNTEELALLRAQLWEGNASSASTPGHLVQQLAPELRELNDLVCEYFPLFDSLGSHEDLSESWSFSLDWCSPKVRILVETLVAHHTPTFQGIVFVEQRHVAVCLAKLLPRIPQLKDLVRSAECVGHGGDNHDPGLGMRNSRQREVVNAFREGMINLLVATQVAEEGLDFPACDVVIRFDSIQHMVGYVQSRGRARHKTSAFVVMVQEGESTDLERYRAFSEKEPEIRKLYEQSADASKRDEENDAYVHPVDLFARERYTVQSTGAVLTYDNAIEMLNHLCSLIPCEQYMPQPLPIFAGDFVSTLQLPSALPLPPEHLSYIGPKKQSKKEAKRAVAFIAVKALHGLDIFDDYLLPARSPTDYQDDADGRPLTDVSGVPPLMNVVVRDPWTLGEKMWTHTVSVDGRRVASLVTGTPLPPRRIVLGWRQLLQEFTNFGLWWYVTSRPVELPLSCYLVPVHADSGQLDFVAMEKILAYPFGNYDWSAVGEDRYDHILFRNRHRDPISYVLHRIRHDLTPMSIPPEGSREAEFPTYHEYYLKHFKATGVLPEVPSDGPLVEGYRFSRQVSGTYQLHPSDACVKMKAVDNLPHVLPLSFCAWYDVPEDIYRTFPLFPRLLHRISDVWRAHCARLELGLPAITDDLLVEAFTIPEAGAGFNNQRLETLGDAVLEVCTSVHIFNRFPHRHEGQLSALRQRCISNRTLLSRAKDVGLEHHLTSEPQNNRTWRYVVAKGEHDRVRAHRFSRRRFARRSLQDCMEASLGASFLTGGIEMALQTGTVLALNFGGPTPWSVRYSRPPEPLAMPALFRELQETLGYEFHRPELLAEAMTHPTFFEVPAGHFSPAFLAAIAGGLRASPCVNRPIGKSIPILQETTTQEMVAKSWAHDPPKVLSDVLESLVAAVLIDSAYNYEKTAAVVEVLMGDALEVLSPDMPLDPVSALLFWTAKSQCRRICLRKSRSRPESNQNDTIHVLVHDRVVVGPITASRLSVAKAFACEKARLLLQDDIFPQSLQRICDCSPPNTRKDRRTARGALEKDVPAPNDETEEGYAALAERTLDEFRAPEETQWVNDDSGELEWEVDRLEEQEVEQMITVLYEGDDFD